jgi:NAD(P)-dependent dehydrogenase (short-subunit alcohol dehydrogenase family)
MNGRFNGKIAIVTGAASGIGRAVAERFLDEGASAFAVDRNLDTLAKLPPGSAGSRISAASREEGRQACHFRVRFFGHAHKFTRLNDLRTLSVLLPNF